MTRTRPLLLFVGGLAVLGGAALALPHGHPPTADTPIAATVGKPVLVEVFTSQGCSSCPPADALAARLAREPGLVVISRPVTYWDRLGWKDTLARESNTALQQNYTQAGLAGYNGIYTPQVVVNGSFGAVGSRAEDVTAGIARYAASGDAAIRVVKQGEAGYAVDLAGTGAGAGAAELVLVAVTRHVEVVIGSGENGGRRVGYANVLRAERKLAGWNGGKASIVVSPAQLAVPGADRYAVVLRQPGGGKVLAARWLS